MWEDELRTVRPRRFTIPERGPGPNRGEWGNGERLIIVVLLKKLFFINLILVSYLWDKTHILMN